MSLLDESFPDDEFFKELELSFNKRRLFQFPNRRKCTAYKTTKFTVTPESEVISTMTPPSTNTNTSASSTGTTSSEQQNLSTESANAKIPNELQMNAKMIASDPTGLAVSTAKDEHGKSVEPSQCNRQTKSYQDIHNEYTKRRYQHVESKVGKYIASIKAEEQKRRSLKFQRHQSMPSTLLPSMMHNDVGTAQTQEIKQQQQKSMRHSTTDLYKLNESAGSDVDAIEAINAMTNSAYTSSSQGATGSSSGSARHESSDEALNGADFIDKMVYAQLVEEKEYIELRLKEKSNENVRLKRNVDFMRIELTNCQDKLKRLSSTSNLSNRSSLLGYSYCGSVHSADALACYPYGNAMMPTITMTKATQTDAHAALMLRTPMASALQSDSSAAGLNSSNVLRQRTNSNASTKMLNSNGNGNGLRPKYPSSTDTGFGSRKILTSPSSSPSPSAPSSPTSSITLSPDTSTKSSPAMLNCKRSNRRAGGGAGAEVYTTTTTTHYDRRSVRYATVAMLNASDESDVVFKEHKRDRNGDYATTTTTSTVNAVNNRNNNKRRQRSTSLRHRFMRLIGRCTRCDDPNQTFESYGDAIQMTQSPMPFLNRDGDNACLSP